MAEIRAPELFKAVLAYTFNENLMKFSIDKEYISVLGRHTTDIIDMIIGEINVSVNRAFSAKYSRGQINKSRYSVAQKYLNIALIFYLISATLIIINTQYYDDTTYFAIGGFFVGLLGMVIQFWVIFKNGKLSNAGSKFAGEKGEILKIINPILNKDKMKGLEFYLHYDLKTNRLFVLPLGDRQRTIINVEPES